MVAPKWIETRCQPISIGDVLAYLVGVLGTPATAGRVLEVGGPDVLTYHQMMDIYAEVAGLRRRHILGVPVLTPQLSSYWIGLVTPIPVSLARPLVQSLVNEVIVHDHRVDELLPRDNAPFRQALEDAVAKVRDLAVDTNWAGAELRTVPAHPRPTDPSWAGGTVLSNDQTVHSDASAERLFATVAASAASGAGTPPVLCGSSAACSTSPSAGSACGGAAASPTSCASATRSTSGGSRRSCPTATCCCGPRCAFPARPGSSSASSPKATGSRLEQRARFSPEGPLGPGVLVLAAAVPRRHLQAHGPPAGRGGRPAARRGPDTAALFSGAGRPQVGRRKAQARPRRRPAPRSRDSRSAKATWATRLPSEVG